MWYRERERGEREREGGGEGPGRTEEDIRKCFFYFFLYFYFFFIIFFSLFFLFLLHEDQSPGSIHSKDTQMLVARDDSVIKDT